MRKWMATAHYGRMYTKCVYSQCGKIVKIYSACPWVNFNGIKTLSKSTYEMIISHATNHFSIAAEFTYLNDQLLILEGGGDSSRRGFISGPWLQSSLSFIKRIHIYTYTPPPAKRQKPTTKQ